MSRFYLVICWWFCAGTGFQAAPASAASHFHWSPFLGPFHSVVLHFPIGFLVVAGILELITVMRRRDDLRRVTRLVIWLSLLAGILTAALGWLRAGGGGYDAQAVEWHRIFGLGVPVFTLLTLGLQRLAARSNPRRSWTYAYLAVLAATLALVVVAGHLGGNLTHGSKYLTANAPAFVKDLIEPDDASATLAEKSPTMNQWQRYYQDKVQPVLEAKCYKCHGPEKQKGGYRLDKPELALKGGDSGKPGIRPTDPVGSYLVQLILLPPEHDDVMPPEGKEPLEIEEIATVLNWIRNGAAFPAEAALSATGH